MLITKTSNIEHFISSFAQSNEQLLDNFKALRNPALDILKTMDFPTTRDEYWKYTRTTKISKSSYVISPFLEKVALDKAIIPGLDAYKIVFQNGILDKEASDWHIECDITAINPFEQTNQDELKSFFGSSLDYKKNIFNGLNSAFFTSGIVIKIKQKLDKPIHIIHYLSGENILAQPRIIVITDKHAEGKIITSTISQEAKNILFNPVYECFLNENSSLNMVHIQNEDQGVFHVHNSTTNQQKDSTLTLYHYSLKGDWIRNNVDVLVNGENCETNLFGAYIAKNNQMIDNHTMIDHKVAHCQSNELYKGSASDTSTITFNGKVFVRKDAQKINAFQSNNTILLSDQATVNSKPELEIYADDVKCSHGSTTGQLDEEALFYLQSRGVSKEKARELLVGAFIGEVVEKLQTEELKDYIKTLYELL